MSINRRELGGLALAGMMSAATAHAQAKAATVPPAAGRRILVLGGTRFVGPAIVRAGLARGHRMTLFNRQRTNPGFFPGLERIKGNRFPMIDEGLGPLTGRQWDAVIDITAYYPRLVEASCALLKGRVGQYVVMSSISAYADFKVPELVEGQPDRPLRQSFEELPDLEENDWPTYGARKALCEQVAATHFPASWASVRATHIHGHGNLDGSGAYWAARLRRGGDVLGPGDGRDPVQFVDAKDVADLIMTIIEKRLSGVYNAAAPSRATTMAEYVAAVGAAVGATARVRWYGQHDDAFRAIPLYAPRAVVPGFHRASIAKAKQIGFAPRSIGETVLDDYVSFVERYGPAHDFAANGTGVSAEREAALLDAARGRSGDEG